MIVKKGQIYLADIPSLTGHPQKGRRPVVIIQNDTGNKHSPTVIVACLTSQIKKTDQPTHLIFRDFPGRIKEGMILFEQIHTIDKAHLIFRLGELNETGLKALNKALKVSLDL